MGQVVTDVTVNDDGQIVVWFGPCCSKVLDGVLASGGVSEDIGDDPLNPSGDPGFQYSACGKASAIVSIVYDIVSAAWDELDVLPNVFRYIPAVEHAVGYDLDNNWLISLAGTILAAIEATGADKTAYLDTLTEQEIICALVEMFSDNSEGVPTQEMFNDIKDVFKQKAFSLIEPLASPVFDCALNALGRHDMDTVAKLGAGNLTAFCGCPGEEPAPPADEVYFTGAWQNTSELAGAQDGTMSITTLSVDKQKIDINWAGTSSYGSTDRTAKFLMAADGDGVSSIDLRFTGVPPTNDWDSEPPCSWSNVQHGSFVFEESSVAQEWTQIDVGADYVTWRAVFKIADVQSNVHPIDWGYHGSTSARWCGRYAPNPFTRDHAVEIINYTQE